MLGVEPGQLGLEASMPPMPEKNLSSRFRKLNINNIKADFLTFALKTRTTVFTILLQNPKIVPWQLASKAKLHGRQKNWKLSTRGQISVVSIFSQRNRILALYFWTSKNSKKVKRWRVTISRLVPKPSFRQSQLLRESFDFLELVHQFKIPFWVKTVLLFQ